MRLEYPCGLSLLHDTRGPVVAESNFPQFQQHILPRGRLGCHGQRSAFRPGNQSMSSLIVDRQLSQPRILIRRVNPQIRVARVKSRYSRHINNCVIEQSHARQLRRNIQPRARIQHRHIRRNSRGPQHRHQQRGLVFAVSIFEREGFGWIMRHNRRLTKFDSGVTHLAIDVIENCSFLLGPRRFSGYQPIDNGLHRIWFCLAVHNLRILGCHRLPRCARRIVDLGKEIRIRRQIRFVRFDALQRSNLVGNRHSVHWPQRAWESPPATRQRFDAQRQ